MRKGMNRLISLLCSTTIFASMLLIPASAADSSETSTTYHNAFETVGALEYDEDKVNVTTAGFSDEANQTAMKNGGYLSYVANWDYVGYSVNLPKEADYISITYNSYYKPSWATEILRVSVGAEPAHENDYANPLYWYAKADIGSEKSSSASAKDTLKLKLSKPIPAGNHTIWIQFPSSGITFYGFSFGSYSYASEYISVLDYVDTTASRTEFFDGLKESDPYAGYIASCYLAFDCYFDKIPNYIEFDVAKTVNTFKGSFYVCLDSQSNGTGDKCLTTFDNATLNSEFKATGNKTTVRLPVNNISIKENEVRRVYVYFDSYASMNFYGFRFIRAKDAFEKFSAADVDIWPTSGNIYNTTSDSTSGFTEDFQNSLNGGYLGWCSYVGFTYDCYFDKAPDYVEIECDGTYQNGYTIGIGLDSNAYALATFSKDVLSAQKGKGKIVIPLTSDQKAKITPGTLRKVFMKLDTGGVSVYSIKFSTAREVFYDEDNSKFCVYGDSPANANAFDEFIAISAGYNGKRLKTTSFDKIPKGEMREIACENKGIYKYKVFLWENFNSLKPLSEVWVEKSGSAAEDDDNLSSTDEMDRIRAIKPDYEGSYKTVKDKNSADVRLPFKLYNPKENNGTGVAFLIIHGGGWHAIKEDVETWDGNNMQFQAQYYADKGFPALAISYRDISLTDETTAFDLIQDCKDAIDFMKKEVSFNKLVIMGESSGGHLAVELGLDAEVGAAVVVGLNPVLDVVNGWTYVAKTDDDRKKLSPAFNAAKGDTKYLIMHGTADTVVKPEISEKFVEDMKGKGTDCEYIGIDGAQHSFIISRYLSSDDDVLKYMGMIDKYLEGTGIYAPDPTEYFSTYKSNTTAGLGSHYTFTDDGTERKGRVFYKISASGEYDYSFTFSGTIDSTYANGSIGKANKICPDFKITRLKAAVVPAGSPKNGTFDFKNVTFHGQKSVDVVNGRTVYTDPVTLKFDEGDFICLEISYKGTEMPKIYDRMVSSYRYDNSSWESSGDVLAPGFVGCDKNFKKSVVFIGDSITQGVGTAMDSYNHYVAETEKLLGDDYSVRNIGLGYARAKDAATCGEWLQKAKYADVVVVCLGVNDLLHDTLETENTLCGFYDTILNELSDGKRKIVWQTVPPACYSTEYKINCWNTANKYIKETIASKVAAVFDTVPFLQLSEEKPYMTAWSATATDRVHPGATYCKTWAEKLAPVLKGVLEAN